MNIGKNFDKLVEKYSSSYGANPEYNYFLEELMTVVRKGKILDLGCGDGMPISKHLFDHGYDIVGVDVSKKMITAAKKNVPKAEFIHEDAGKIELEQQSYDGVVALFVLNHFPKKELEKLMIKVSKAVKEDGGILVGAIEGDFEGETSILGEKIYLREMKEEELRELLKDFHVVMVEKREFALSGETAQNQMYIIAKKKTLIEEMLEEEHNEETIPGPEEPKAETVDKMAKDRNKDDPDNEEKFSIKISLFKGKKR
jgi:2-polyprenyl-3-methyl-5-hydroxy-6-metoxy-1,4-benzoquinol methylase